MALFTGVVGELSSMGASPVAPATSAMAASIGALALGSVRTQAEKWRPSSPRLGDHSAPSAHRRGSP